MSEAVPFHLLPSLLDVRPGVTAVIGSGGKTTLLVALAALLAAQSREGARTSVVLATSTRILPFPELPLYTADSADELAGHQTVRNVVQLLKDHAAEHGQAEFPQHGGRMAHRQILIHKRFLLYPAFVLIAELSYNFLCSL